MSEITGESVLARINLKVYNYRQFFGRDVNVLYLGREEYRAVVDMIQTGRHPAKAVTFRGRRRIEIAWMAVVQVAPKRWCEVGYVDEGEE
ncbi:MAG: hypothetical protein WC247_12250 [Porticoccaceae bacterium]